MNAYHALAASYDRLTSDVDYAAVVKFYQQILEKGTAIYFEAKKDRPDSCILQSCRKCEM